MAILLPQLFTAVLAIGLGSFIWSQAPASRVNRAFAFYTLALSTWLISQAIGVPFQGSPAEAFFWSKVCYTGVPFITATMYHFVAACCRVEVRRPSLKTAYLFGLLCVLLSWTTPWIISGVHQFSWGYFTAAGTFHPIFLVFFFWVYARCLSVFLHAYHQPNPTLFTRNQSRYLLASLLITGLGSVDYLPEYGFNMYPKGYIFEIAF